MNEEFETHYWLINTPTIAEVRRLNQETAWTFPLSVLNALVGAGVDIDSERDAVLKQRIVEDPDMVYAVIDCRLNGKLIAVLGIGTHDDGSSEYFAMRKRPAAAMEAA